MSRTVVTYKPESDVKTGKGLRLYIKDGVVMNADVDTKIVEGIQTGELTAVAIRQSGKGRRSLVVESVEISRD